MKLKQGQSRKCLLIHMMIVFCITIVAMILNSTYSYATGDQIKVRIDANYDEVVREQVAFEQKVSDIQFALHQFELINMPSFYFSIEISDNAVLRQLMLVTINDLLDTFKKENPDIAVETNRQQNDKMILIVKLITEENWIGLSHSSILI